MPEIKGWKFPVEVDEKTGRIITIDDNDNVKQGLEIILRTQKGERKMRPSFGTNINRFMFGSVNLTFINQMITEVTRSIRMWEKHIDQLFVNVEQSDDNISKVKVDIEYKTDIIPEIERLSKEINTDDVTL